MPKDTTKVAQAHNGKRLATTHGLPETDQERLEQALRDSARTIAPNMKGPARNALYASHSDQIYNQFSAVWNFSQATPKWTMSSIHKVLQNYLFDFNKKKGTQSKPGRKAPGAKAKQAAAMTSDQDRSSKSGPVIKQEMRAAGRPHKPFDTGTASSFQSINRPARSPDPKLITSSSSPLRSTSTLSQASQSPIDPVLPSIERNVKTPFNLEGVEDGTEARVRSFSEQSVSVKLAEIIVAVTPSLDDPWGRKVVSFPLWRCQVSLDGRDAAPEALQDWRDISFFDFVRQLKAEEVVSTGDVLVWGEFDQIVRSDVTFAGAIQEQLLDAGHNGLAFNEANFAVIKGSSKSS